MYTRRDLAKLAAGALGVSRVLNAKPNSVVRGVTIGVQSYSFRDRPISAAIKAIADAGISHCELWQGHLEPRSATRKGLREWRENIALEQFVAYRDEFTKAGVKLYAYNYSFQDDFSDAEIERGFEMAKALGVKYITASANVNVCKRVNAFALRHDIVVAVHNHDSMKENEFSSPDDFLRGMQDNSNIRINLDIGHFTAANFNVMDYLQRMAPYIVDLHIKDRKKDHGPNMPFGQGDTPIREVLQYIASQKMKIPAMIEYEYQGKDSLEEVRRCYEFCRSVLKDMPD